MLVQSTCEITSEFVVLAASQSRPGLVGVLERMQEFRIVEPPCSLSGVKPKQTTFTAISDADVQDLS